MPKNILILQASPRLEGNTHTLAEMFRAGAETSGHRVRQINIGKANISGCHACNYCRDNDHTCQLDDDMQKIYSALLCADCVVFAAPLYFFGLPSHLKSVLDRLYAFGPEYFQKEGVLLMTAGDNDKRVFEAAKKNYQMAVLEYLHWTDKGMLLVPGVYAPSDIKDNPALLEAYKMGFNL